jgi:hypothetical protein
MADEIAHRPFYLTALGAEDRYERPNSKSVKTSTIANRANTSVVGDNGDTKTGNTIRVTANTRSFQALLRKPRLQRHSDRASSIVIDARSIVIRTIGRADVELSLPCGTKK